MDGRIGTGQGGPGSGAWMAGVLALVAGTVLGLVEPLLVVEVGPAIVAGPTYVGLLFLLCAAVALGAAAVMAAISSSRPAGWPILLSTALLAMGLVGGNVLAANTHLGWAANAGPDRPSGPGWTRAADMLARRADHSATLLADGRVLVAGGRSDVGPLSSAELFDPGEGRWESTGSMVTPSAGHVATRLADGRVLVTSAAGLDVEIYDPRTGTWTAAADMPTPRRDYTATLLQDGRVLVAGGTSVAGSDTMLGAADLFDPASGAWSGTSPMTSPRSGHAAALLADGRVLVAGGLTGGGAAAVGPTRSGAASGAPPLAWAELFDPKGGTWNSTTAPLLGGNGPAAAVRLTDGSVLVVTGGFPPDAQLFDPVSADWRSGGSVTSSLLTEPDLLLLRNGTILLVNALGLVELYDPRAPGTPHVRLAAQHGSGATATVLADGRILFAGGSMFTGHGLTTEVSASVDLLDPSALGSSTTFSTPAPVTRGPSLATSMTPAPVTVDYMIAGGDGYSMLAAGNDIQEPDEGLLAIVTAYVAASSPVASTVEGRILGP